MYSLPHNPAIDQYKSRSWIACYRSKFVLFCWAVLCSLASSSFAANSSPAQRDLFENHVRPMLVKHCIKCHGETKQEGGLKLTSMSAIQQGGDSGPAIVPGKAAESLLVEALKYESYEMPPSGQLEDDVVQGIAIWINAGAPWPNGLVLKPTSGISADDQNWWCYQPISNVNVPEVQNSEWCRNEIDQFILARLEAEGISPSSDATTAELTRRASYSVTGLPPNASDMTSQGFPMGSYEAYVDKLLDSPAYGENQARYWLDLVRYADSDGYNADHSRPEAYKYRDYVIRSFNEDKPYDRFIQEQLAGDEIDPGNPDAIIATMYLRHWIYEHNQRDVEGQWQQILNDVTETTSDVFLAQGLKCARCHDHKFDPLLQRDFFAMKAFFTPLVPREDQPVADVQTREKYLAQLNDWKEKTKDIRSQLHEIERPVLLKHASREGADKFTKEIQAMLATEQDSLSPYENQIATLASKQFDVDRGKLSERLKKDQETKRQELLKELAKFEHLIPKPLPTMKFVASDVGPVAPPTTIPDIEDAKPIAPGYPTVIEAEPASIMEIPAALQSTGRRTTLAHWITSADNPLTARVIVNRIWQQHFGRGLVSTTSDFGHLGTPPSHPELLDWLAKRFMDDGWSIKNLHRLILMSSTYRQTTHRQANEKLSHLDPQNVLLWKMNPRRLSGEEIHDTMLVATGEMSQGKRAIYKQVKRNKLDPLLAVFDFPDRVQSQCKRHRTTTSPQALLMMNNPWLQERAQALAKQFKSRKVDDFITEAHQRLYFRSPNAEELEKGNQFFTQYKKTVPPPKNSGEFKPFLNDSALTFKVDKKQTVQLPILNDQFTNTESGDFTVEAYVLLESLYADASVRTIVAGWSGKNSDAGWSLGVTSTKSSYQPRNLILQLVGSKGDKKSKIAYEVVASNLRMELNKPYYVAVSLNPKDTSKNGIRFYLKDLSKPDSKLQSASVAHKAQWNLHAKRPIEFGKRASHHYWDGLIHRVRISNSVIPESEIAVRATTMKSELTGEAPLLDVRFADSKTLGQDLTGNGRHANLSTGDAANSSPDLRARIALLHAYFCSNEMIYVD